MFRQVFTITLAFAITVKGNILKRAPQNNMETAEQQDSYYNPTHSLKKRSLYYGGVGGYGGSFSQSFAQSGRSYYSEGEGYFPGHGTSNSFGGFGHGGGYNYGNYGYGSLYGYGNYGYGSLYGYGNYGYGSHYGYGNYAYGSHYGYGNSGYGSLYGYGYGSYPSSTYGSSYYYPSPYYQYPSYGF
jgi:hypothetical protein